MNAAILLVSSAWMAGQTPDMVIPVSHAQPAGCCGSSCGSSCSDRPSLHDRIRGIFHRDRCDSCAPPRCHASHCHQPSCAPSCHSCGTWSHGNSNGGGLLERIHSRFRHDCGSCGSSSCCGGSAVIMAPAAEPIKEAPGKKLPTSPPQDKGKQEASVITTPAQAPLPAIQNAPTIAPAAPTLSPRIIENDTRNPF